MSTSKRTVSCVTLIVALALGNSLRAQGADRTSATAGFDFSGIKKELAVFQGVIDTTVRQNLPGPFPILGSTRGTYLPDYGAVFNLELNIYRIRQLSPFDMRPHTEKELDDSYNEMMRKIESVQGLLIKAIGEHGSSLDLLKPGENLSIVVYLFSSGGDGKRTFPSQMVLNVKKSSLQDYREKKISLDDFKKQIRIIQF